MGVALNNPSKEGAMPTIVEYTDARSPQNRYPERIVSPPRQGACCSREMEPVGTPEAEGRVTYQYRRCRRCGFTVRAVVKLQADPQAFLALRLALERLSSEPNPA